jgi:pyruvate kinase
VFFTARGGAQDARSAPGYSAPMSTAPDSRRNTRIVATIGPSSRDPSVLQALLEAGVDVCRINCSHATAESIRTDVARIRRLAAELRRPVGVLLDLQGPKIRTGAVPTPLTLQGGDVLRIRMDPGFVGVGQEVGTTWPEMAQEVKAGERVLFADGALSGTIESVHETYVDVRMVHGGLLGSHKGINLPDSDIQAPALTEKDIADLAVGVQAGADFVALSFVRAARDILLLREHLAGLGAKDTPIVAKIEKPQAVDAIDSILAVTDGIMVARGDLGVEMELERVPVVQKELIERANRAGVLVITATQMLDSMERNPTPTRAETTDVANAILDGTDAVMLSGETANGSWPVRAVQVMDRIARYAEQSRFLHRPELGDLSCLAGPSRAVARAACYAVRETPRPLAVFTWTGHVAILASKSRPTMRIFAMTPHPQVADRLCLAWGVTSVIVPVMNSTDALIAAGESALMREGLVARGEEIVVLAGNAPLRGATNIMKLEVVDGR